GMCVNGLHHHLDRSFRFHCRHCLADQLESLRSDDVHAQNLAVLFIRHHFDEPFVMAQNRRAAVPREWKTAHLDLPPLSSRPRSSSTFVFSSPMRSVFGLRPTATSSFSASSVSCLPSFVVSVSFTPEPVF